MARVPGAARGAKVVLPDGAVRAVKVPAKAAELMLEAPGHFLADARALRAGKDRGARRRRGPRARGPVRRVPHEATGRARRAGGHGAPGGRGVQGSGRRARSSATAKVAAVVVAPQHDAAMAEEEEDAARPRLDEMAVGDAAAEAEISELKQRISGGRRSRRPTLETIHEESYAPAARC